MEEENLEFFKLDDIDRKILIWLLEQADIHTIKSWINFISVEYKRKDIIIDAEKLYNETLL